jgi:uncharacterized membrane protein affecting hemolysin expression
MVEDNRPSQFRFRLSTVLFVVAVLALLLVVVIQQVQIARMRQQIDRYSKEKDQLTTIIREQRDRIERQR